MDALQSVADGDIPDIVYLELIANSEVHDTGDQED